MVVASPVATFATAIYSRYHVWLKRFETEKRLLDDALIDVGDASVVVLGMGRIGSGAYESLSQHYGKKVIGVDFDAAQVEKHAQGGKFVIQGDAVDYDFWQRGGFGDRAGQTCAVNHVPPGQYGGCHES